MKLEILFISLLFCDSFTWLTYSVYSVCEPSVCADNQRSIWELTDKVLIKVPGTAWARTRCSSGQEAQLIRVGQKRWINKLYYSRSWHTRIPSVFLTYHSHNLVKMDSVRKGNPQLLGGGGGVRQPFSRFSWLGGDGLWHCFYCKCGSLHFVTKINYQFGQYIQFSLITT